MSIHEFKQWMKWLACILLIAAIAATPSSAQEKIKIAGKMTLTQPGGQATEIGDMPGHQLIFGQERGMNLSTGEHKFLDSAEAVNMNFSDLTQGRGPQQGYLRISSGADTVFIKWQGEVTSTLSPEKTPIISYQGVWFYTRGTGQFHNIQGKGTYKGKFISETEHLVEWEGEYLIKE